MRYVDGRWGRIWFIGKDEYVGRSLYNYGEYGPDETETILSLANGLCLDIGANFGVMGQALENSGFNVISFEPQPDIFKLLCKIVEVTCHNTTLGNEEGFLKMPKVLFGAKCNYGGLSIGTRSDLGTIDVRIKKLDSFNFEGVGFMKIDVEGYEKEVLLGAADTIARCRPIMYIEDDRVEKSAALRAHITSLGYTIEVHEPTLYRKENYFGLERNVWNKNYVSKNLICRPC